MESVVLEWLASNWPSAVTAVVLAVIYVRLGRFIETQEITVRRLGKLIRAHCQRHPEDGVRIFDDSEKADD